MKILFISPYIPSKEKPHITPFIGRIYHELNKSVDVTLYSFTPHRKVLNYIKARKEVKKLLKKTNYDIIHINWGHTILVVPFFIKAKLVTSFRGSDVYGIVNQQGKHTFISRIGETISKYAAYRSTHCIYVSQELKNHLNSKTSFSIIPSGVDSRLIPSQAKSELRRQIGFRTDEIIIIFCGHPSNSRKRYSLIEEILAEINKDYTNVRLVHVWKKEPEVVFRMMKAADFLLQISIQEGSPNIVKEAIACNLSIISTPVGDTPTRIGNLPYCYLTEGYSKEEIVKTIKVALAEFRHDRMNDFKDELSSFSLENEKSKILKIYTEIFSS